MHNIVSMSNNSTEVNSTAYAVTLMIVPNYSAKIAAFVQV